MFSYKKKNYICNIIYLMQSIMKREGAKIFGACVQGSYCQVKAYKKENALAKFQLSDDSLTLDDIYELEVVNNSQVIIEEFEPDLYK